MKLPSMQRQSLSKSLTSLGIFTLLLCLFFVLKPQSAEAFSVSSETDQAQVSTDANDHTLETAFLGFASSSSSCGGTVFRDDNGNGTNDDGVAIGGVTMAIYNDLTGVLLGTATTDSSGVWTIGDLPAFTDVYVTVLASPGLLQDGPLGPDHTGQVQYLNTSDCSGLTTSLLLVSACSNLPLEIGTTVWLDENADGLQNGNEPGIAGVTVNLYEDGTNNLIATTLTDADGHFIFTSDDGLLPNTAYDIRIDNAADTAPGGPLVDDNNDPYALTLANQGADEERDSDATLVSSVPQIDATTGALGTSRHYFEAGFVPPASIGDVVWIDHNGNGVQDTYSTANYSTDLTNLGGYDFSSMISYTGTTALEEGIPNVTVELWDNTGTTLIATTTTDSDGKYLFRPVIPAAQYQVRVDDTTLPAGYVQTYDEDGAGDNQSFAPAATTITAGEQYMTADFGYGFQVDLEIDKSANSEQFQTGDFITYTIDVTNNSLVDAPNVVVTDRMTGDPSTQFNVLFGRIFEEWFVVDSNGDFVVESGSFNTGNYEQTLVYTNTQDMLDAAETWLLNNVTVSGTNWSCQYDPHVYFTYVDYIEYFSSWQYNNSWYQWPPLDTVIELNLACELNNPLAGGASAPPINIVISNEYNLFTHEFEYPDQLAAWDTAILYEQNEDYLYTGVGFHTAPVSSWNTLDNYATIENNSVTNAAHVESRYGQEPLGLDADNADQVIVSLQGDLEITKTLNTAGPYNIGDIVEYTVSVGNVGTVPWYSDIHVADTPLLGGMMPVTSTLPTVDWSCYVDGEGTTRIVPYYRLTSSWSSTQRPEGGFACYYPPIDGGLQPGDSVSFTYQAYIASPDFVDGNSFVADDAFANVATLIGASANDEEPNNNWARIDGTMNLLPNAFTKGVNSENINSIVWEIGMAGLTVGDLQAGQDVFVKEYLPIDTPFESAANGWQCETFEDVLTNSTTTDDNYVMCWYDYDANGLGAAAAGDPIPDLLLTVSKPLAWAGTNRACASIGYYLGYQSYAIGNVDDDYDSGNACEAFVSGSTGGGGAIQVDFAITKTHSVQPWAEGSTYTWTLTIDEIGVGSDVPIVEDILQPGTTLVAVRNATGDLLLDDTDPVGATVDGIGWDCTLDVAGGVGTATPQEFSCVRDTAMLTNTRDVLTVEVLVGIDAGAEVTNNGVVYAQNLPEPGTRAAITHDDCWTGADTSGLADNCDSDSVPLSAVDFEISKTHDSGVTYYNGDPITSTIVITNNTAGLAPPNFFTQDANLPLTITDTLPSYSNFLGFSGTGWSCNWTAPAAESDTSEVICTYTEGDALLQQNEATAPLSFIWNRTRFTSAKNTVEVTSSDRIIVNSATPDLVDDTVALLWLYPRVDKGASPTTVLAGETLTYTIGLKSQSTGSNYAPLPAPVRITDTIPVSMTVQSVGGAGWDCAASAGQLVDCTYIGSGVVPTDLFTTTYQTFDVVVEVDHDTNSSTIENIAYYDSRGRALATSSYGADAVNVTVLEQVDLSISKTRDIAEPKSDDILDYTVVITNYGTSSADNVVVTDLLPYGSSYVDNAGSDPAWACSGDGNNPETVTCNLAGTVPGSGVNGGLAPALQIRVQLTQDSLPGITNFISLSTSSPVVSSPTGSTSATDEVILVTGCIGDYVWWDTGRDGVEEGIGFGDDGTIDSLDDIFTEQGPGLDGISGTADDGQHGFQNVVMTLDYAGPDNIFGTGDDVPSIITTTTDATGYYIFDFLLPGTYQVTVDNTTGTLVYDGSSITNFFPTFDLDSGTTNPDLTSEVSIPNTGIITDMIRMDVDFGLDKDGGLSALGNYIWVDEDGDGEQDAGERGIPNVVVTLTPDITIDLGNGAGVAITMTTDANGGYLFDMLPAGDYTVSVDPNQPALDGLDYTQPALTGEDYGNQDPTGYSITLGVNEVNLTADFGYNYASSETNTGTAALGDRIWVDVDGDGAQDPDEIGIPNITLVATDSQGNTYTTTTDAQGYYIFDNLPPEAYTVEVINPPAGWTHTGDPDHYGTTGTSNNITDDPIILGPGDFVQIVDFGYQPPAADYDNSIGDTIWLDADADGVEDPNEPGIEGVTVALYDSNGDVIATTTTDDNGNYLFPNLPDGTYSVVVTDTGGVLAALKQTGDPDATLDDMSTTFVTGGMSDLNQDFGYTPINQNPSVGMIGDYVWLDQNGDTVQDPGEQGIAGVDVTLEWPDGSIYTTTTDANGFYAFPNLPIDADGETYTVTVVTSTLPPDVTQTFDDDGLGSPDQSVTTIDTTTPIDLEQDFGYQGLNSLSGTIWEDLDADGTLAAESVFFEDVTVLLLDSDGNVVASTSTDANGDYSFVGLPDGEYTVVVEDANGVLNGYWHSDGPNDGNDNNSQSDPYKVDLDSGSAIGTPVTDTTADFGYYIDPASVGNWVWLDANKDGIQNDGETGINGVEVTLVIEYPDSTSIILTTTTGIGPNGNAGWYSFNNLLMDEDYNGDGTGPEPTYTISVDTAQPALAGYETTLIDDGGATDLTDSDDPAGVSAQPLQGQENTARPNDNNPIASYDFGFYREAVQLGNYVWNDLNNNGTIDTGESPIENVVLGLLDSSGSPILDLSGQPITTTTDASGHYLFTNLLPGDYIVSILPENFDEADDPLFGFVSSQNDINPDPAVDPDINASDVDDNGLNSADPATTGIQSHVITLSNGSEPTGEIDENGLFTDADSNLTVDFGFFEMMTLGNLVWIDTNDNGIVDPSESGAMAGISLTLLDENGDPVIDPVTGNPITTTTDENGRYYFTGLFPGTYMVLIDPENFLEGGPLEGYVSSTGSSDSETDGDNDDNGSNPDYHTIDGIVSSPIVLEYGEEPDNGADGDDNDNTNFSIDFGVTLHPTSVELISFTAERSGDNSAIIRWVTGSEVDNFGFRLLRSTDGDIANAQEIHFEDSLVTTGPGASYRHTDTGLAPDTYFYWLVDVETTGVETTHGPIIVSVGRGYQIFLPIVSD